MDLKQLQYFVQVCDANSISEAALQVHISQPSISRQIRLLEEELGVSLLERRSRGIVLTDAGVALRDRAIGLLEEAARIRTDLVTSVSVPHGILNVGSVTSLRNYLIAPALAAFRGKYDAVTCRIIEGTSRAGRDAVVSGAADVAFVSTLEDAGSFGSRRLLTEQLFLVAHRSRGLKIDAPVEIDELFGAELILTSRPNSLRVIVDRALRHANGRGRVVLEVGSLDMAIQLVGLGLGLSVFPFCAVDEFYRRGVISIAPIRNLSISWALVYSMERRLSVAARLFMDVTVEELMKRVRSGDWPTAELAPDMMTD